MASLVERPISLDVALEKQATNSCLLLTFFQESSV
jgi:hypothetical protein